MPDKDGEVATYAGSSPVVLSLDSGLDTKMDRKSLKILQRGMTSSDLHFRKPILVTVQRMDFRGARVGADEQLKSLV